ncbi:chemotaxis protein CheA [Lichenifustis flavocetrariae]|uniref:Chemotaxis protein CheA n=1 Tax=Lichenifustis flavocetrariae TaxID=2949735 RepID=A0AA41YZQ7_9HYPH|nr:chemotaxis protein CheA [Lichenifustis flavocetrariae]MCW6511556.1 chemotaxis protein CheA [Lichenifustis flavocetrariae]
MNPLLAQFIPEARDLLEQAGNGMLALERDAGSQSVINDVFRAVHTLKGSSGLFDVGPLTRLVHAAEDLLGEVRTGEIPLNSDIVDRLLDSLDLVGRWIDALETREALPSDAEATMTERVKVLRSWLAEPSTAGLDRATAPMTSVVTEVPDWLDRFPEADRMTAFKALSRPRLLAWSFEPDEDCFFRGDDPVAMLRHAPGILTLRAGPRAPFPTFDSMDPLSCLLRFEVLSDTTRAELDEHMRYVIERVDIREIASADLASPVGKAAGGPVFGDFGRLARQHLAGGDRTALERAVSTLLTMIAPASFQASALRWVQAHLSCHGLDRRGDLERLIAAVETGVLPPRSEHPAATSSAAEPAPSPTEGEAALHDTARTIAAEQIKVLKTPADPALAQGRLEAVATVLKNLADALGDSHMAAELPNAVTAFRQTGDLGPLQALVETLGEQRPEIPPPDRIAPSAAEPIPASSKPGAAVDEHGDVKALPRVLRVDQSKIDSIMNLVAELIVAKNGLSYLATRAEQVHGSRVVAREIKDQFAVIDRITQGLQVGVMAVRMMPVSQVFQRFPRLVRDISRKLGKKIELVIEGEDTEADKNVLESLADPLIHMVRNSLDHGIETPDERKAAGKPEQGVLKIVARQENDFVVIEVSDDGKGIDPLRVKAKALKLGLISPERAEQMNDGEAINLVFDAGLSTKEEVSDLSGRGVGMDVVRSAVIKAGGEVSLRSTLGAGTLVTVRLPLTMAVTRIVTIECRGRIFGIPMDHVVETVRVKREHIHRIKAMETFVLRDTIIPIARLARALRLPEVASDAQRDEEAVMVVKVGRERVGMVVDGFRERLEVIVKPLEGVLEGLPGFSGTALLGDGQVLLVLDLQEML